MRVERGVKKVGIRRSSRLLEKNKRVISRLTNNELKEIASINNKTMTSKKVAIDIESANNMASNSQLEYILKKLIDNKDSISAEGFDKIIPEFDGKSIPVKKWFENFENNADAYELNNKQKYVHARNKMTDVAKLFLESKTVSDFVTLKIMLCDEFHKEMDSAEIHKKLQNRKKYKNETFHEYVLHMNKIAAVGCVEESAIMKYIIEGLDIGNDAKYMLYTSKTTKELREKFEIVNNLSVAKPAKSYEKKVQNKSDNKKAIHCFNCGSVDHLRNECKSDTKCFKCNQAGHIAKNCPQVTKTVNVVNKGKRVKSLFINGVNVEGMIDTGSDVTIIKYAVYKKIGVAELAKCNSILRGLGNIKTQPIGEFTGEVCVDGIQTTQRFVVVADGAIESDALLGYDFIDKFYFSCDHNGFWFSKKNEAEVKHEEEEISIYNIVENANNIVVPPQYEAAVLKMIEEYNPRQELDCPIQLKVVPDGEIKPFRQAPSRLPEVEADVVKKQVNEWLQTGVIRRSSSYVASRVVVVEKKDGTYRVCVDFRKLNSMVLKDCFPVPFMEDIFAKLKYANFFIIMDLENGFFHVPVEESSKKFLAFTTREGLFEFNVAPFGFCNSPAAFIRFVYHIFQKLVNENVMELYMDDIIIYANTAEECLEKANRVFRQAEKFNLKIKWKKCSFLQRRINFLGHVIEDGKMWPGSEKTNAVNKFQIPKNIKAVQSFLGLTGFFRKFIYRYALIARPLTNLLRKNVDFKMGAEELNAVQTLKLMLTSEPVLRIYDRNAPTELHTDASKEGFGTCLLQEFDEKLHPVFYWSKRASVQESNRHSYILEAKAAFLAVKKFRTYLLGIKFKLVTDCQALKHSASKQDVPREVLRWILYLDDFDYTIEHKSGSSMQHVDFLSRYPQNVLTNTTELLVRIKKAQQKDEYIKAIAEILQDRPYENFKVKGDLIYKTIEGNDVLVVPKTMEAEIIREAHNAGHFGLQKTLHTIKQNYWIPHLEKKVGQLISNCIKCIIYNKKLGKKEGFLNYIEKGDAPLYTIHVDHLGPMDSTSKQYKYILSVVDGFSKFVWLYPTKSTGSEEVIKRLTDWKNIFGNPIRLVSDRGAAFTSNIFADFTKENCIEHVLTTTGVARGNGQVERVNRVILSIIAKMSADDTSKWYKHVPQVQTAINTHVHSTTKISPFQLLFGVQMNNKPNDRMLHLLEQEMIYNFDEERRNIREATKIQIQRAQSEYKKNFDKKRKAEFLYSKGDLVAIKRTQFVAGKKLASEYIGPYEIVEVKRNGRYNVRKLVSCDGPNITSTSCDNMKLWRYVEENSDALSSGTDEE